MIFLFPYVAREAPILEVYPEGPQTVTVGQAAQLSCRTIAGIPTPTTKWTRRDRRPLPARAAEDYPGMLTFNEVAVEDSGEYECTASNIAGSVSATVSLNVQQPPIVTLSPNVTELVLTEGDELKLECSAQGTPQPTVVWSDPNSNSSPHVGYLNPESSFRSVSPYAVVQKYNVRKSDEGLYTCTATNPAGEEQRYVQVQVQPKRGDVGKYKS